jgi:cobalt-zinc-cadmium efflux system membrane fusion protein
MGDSVMHARIVLVTALVFSLVAGSACRQKGAEPKEHETPTLDVTSWTDKSELFMEYPPLVTGQSARFAVHLTKLQDFKALNEGKPSVTFTPEGGGAATVFAGTPPLRPGAFRVEGVPPAPGRYRWVLNVDAPSLTDKHDLGVITVFADEKTAFAEAEKQPADDPSAIAYLKEQQWTNEFATTPVREVELRSSVRVPASIEPLTGGEAMVAAPAAGRFAAASLPTIGTTVRPGQVLGRLEPRLSANEDRAVLEGQVAQAQVAVDGARAELKRAEGLLAERAVPARRVEDARRALATAEAQLKASLARLQQRDETLRSGGGAASGNAFTLRAPIGGRIAEVMATLGASYEEGAPLFRIVRTDRVELRVQIPAADAASVRSVADVALEIPGRPDPVTLRPEHMHDAGVVDEKTGALPVQFQIANPGGLLLVGQHATAVLYRRDKVRVPAVNRQAVLTEAGRAYVWVQVGGEQFARRYIDVATRDGDLVGIRSGVKPGDRVVIKGAYEVQLAAASKGLPAEGHVH